MRTITKINNTLPTIRTRKKVAAYARVSVELERMNHSLSAQVSYYNNLIQSNPDWSFVGVYADYGISGTSINKRLEFKQMIEDAEDGKIDIILTKSIQRFARNTVDLLETVRQLKNMGVEVRFEKENINSLSGDGELMLSILASFAQEESRSISENIKWGTRKRFEQGIPNGKFRIYGYQWVGDDLVIEPNEAKIVKLIYDNYLNGISAEQTEQQLEDMGVKSYKGQHFGNTSIRRILGNITYTGNILLQKEYISDPISGKTKINRGELPQYFVENNHEAIIPMETYMAVQEEIKRRRELGPLANKSLNTSCFTSKIKCSICGKNYRRSGKRKKASNSVYYIWICRTKSEKGVKCCDSKCIPEEMLKKVCAKVLNLDTFDDQVFDDKVSQIIVIGDDTLEFHLKDGTIRKEKWVSTARTDCWTDERRKKYAEIETLIAKSPDRFSEFTGFIKCGNCGRNYRVQLSHYSDGTDDRIWRCGGSCGNTSIRQPTITKFVCEALNIEELSKEAMNEKLEKAVILNNKCMIYFKDGSSKEFEYKERKKGILHTQEYKDRMSKIMKGRKKERKGNGSKKSNTNTCNN